MDLNNHTNHDINFSKTGIFIIGHGSQDQEAIKQFWELVDIIKDEILASGDKNIKQLKVQGGFIEFAEPNLDEGLDSLVDQNIQTVIAIPLVLLGAGHLKDDGPVALAKARLRHPNVTFKYANAIGIHHLILDAFAKKMESSIDRTNNGTGALIVSRGSTDPDANSDLYKVARLLIERPDTPNLIEPAFVSLAEPDVQTGLDKLKSLGVNRIIAVPYFLFTGVLLNRIDKQCNDWSQNNAIPVSTTTELGCDRSIIEIIFERFKEAFLDSAHMNCDMCIYRWPIAGFESKVGTLNTDLLA